MNVKFTLQYIMKFQKFFFILLFVLNSLVASEKSYNIVSTDIVAIINQNSTVDISETREFNFKGDFSFVYQDIPKRGFDQLLDIQVIENSKNFFINENSKEPGTFLIEERKSFFRIYLYHKSSNETKKFTINYKLKNPFTIGKDDSQFYWIYLSDRWDKKPGNLSISQSFSGKTLGEDIYFDLEKPSNSEKYKAIIEKSSFTLFSSNFSSKNEMKLRTIFPTSYFENPIINDENFSLALLEKHDAKRKISEYFIIFLVICSSLIFINYAKKSLKPFKTESDKNKNFTSFPSNDHPVSVNALIFRELTLGPTGGGVLATLFELATINKISIELVEKGKWFKSKRLKITINSTDLENVNSSFGKLLLKRLKKFGSETSFKDVFSNFSLRYADWTALKKEEIDFKGWVDKSSDDEKYRLAILQFIILNTVIACSFIFQTFFGFLAFLPLLFFIITFAASRLTKSGQELYNEWVLFIEQIKKNKIDVNHFDPNLLLRYCLALGVEPKNLKTIIKNIETENDSSFLWLHGGDSSIGSVASLVSDIATTGTNVSAAYGGDGGGGGAGGGAGGGGGGGAG